MSYFSQFSYILYPNFDDPTGKSQSILKDITTRVVRNVSPVDDKSIYYKYTLKENETIENLSYTLYGSPNYYWVIMLINERFDRFYDFPLSYGQFEEYMIDKYGSLADAQTTYKYYVREAYEKYSEDIIEDDDNFIEVPLLTYTYIDSDSSNPVIPRPESENGRVMKKTKSLYDIEFEKNEEKRVIILLEKQYLQSFVDLFNSLVR